MTKTPNNRVLSLIWIYNGSLAEILDSATWLETTRELRASGRWQVVLINEGPYERKEINNIEVQSIPRKNVYLVRQALFHLKVLREISGNWKDADIILFHQFSAPFLIPLRYIRRFMGRSTPLFVMDTRTAPMVSKELATLRNRLYSVFQNLMNSLANRTVDGQTTITKRMAELMEVPDSQLFGVWPSGVTPEPFAKKGLDRVWPDVQGPLKLIYVGAIERERCLMEMCNAVIEANRRGIPVEFTVIGGGSERVHLELLAERIPSILRILPPVRREEIPGYLAQAHIGVLPFPDQEQFRVSSPIKLFEYMASGMPVLATRIVCHTDVIGDDGFVFWAEDSNEDSLLMAIEQAWKEIEFLPEYGENASNSVSNWTWKAAASKLSRALLKALDRQTDSSIHELGNVGISNRT
jgi:glycosyltransferase involved in cell wall biosynthesis